MNISLQNHKYMDTLFSTFSHIKTGYGRVWANVYDQTLSYTCVGIWPYTSICWCQYITMYSDILIPPWRVTPFTMKFTLCTSIEAKFQWKLTCLSVHCPSIIQTDVKWNRKFMNFIYQLHISSVKNRSRQTVPDTYRDKNPTYNIPNERES